MAFGQRSFARQTSAFLLGFDGLRRRTGDPPGQRKDFIRSTRERRCHLRLLVHEVGDRCALPFKGLRDLLVLQQENQCLQAVGGSVLEVG